MSTREVILEGGSPWGFRMHGGLDVNQPLRISRVNPGSKASLKGVREGDLITSINNVTTKEITNSEAHRLLRSAGNRLILGLNENSRRPFKHRQFILHQHQEVVKERSKTSKTSTSHTTLIASKSNTESSTSSREEMDEDENAVEKDENGERLTQDTHAHLGNSAARSNKDQSTNHSKVHLKHCIFVKSNDSLIKQAVLSSDLEIAQFNDSESDQEVDETPCVSSVSSPLTPVDTPSSSHYSSDTKVASDSMPQRAKRNRRRRPKNPERTTTNNEEATATTTESTCIVQCDDGVVETLKINEPKRGDDEVSDDDFIAKLSCKEAIISEADDEISWERTEVLEPPELRGNLNAQEEAQLRYFIEKLSLGETCAKRVEDGPRLKATSSAIRQKRCDQRQQMMQFFAPVFDTPRFLGAISEEPSEPLEAKPCVIVQVQNVVEKGEAEVVVLDSSSSDESSSSTSGSLELEPSEENLQRTPSQSPDTEDFRKLESSNSSETSTIVQNDSSPLTLKEYCLKAVPSITYDNEKNSTEEKVHSEVSEIHEQDTKQEIEMNDEEIKVMSAITDRTCTCENKSTVLEEVVTKNVIDISGSRKLLDIVIREKAKGKSVDVGPERTPEEIQELNEARLNARDMSEWLNLVRGTLQRPTDIKWDTGTKDANNCTAPHRRRSLPPEVHIRQMQYLIEKEKRIQFELEKLERERRKLCQMIEKEKRPSSLPPADEKLRQQMYEEYQRQLAQREERKHQKVIKVSMHDAESNKKSKELNEIEKEFMEIVKEKKRKVRESRSSDRRVESSEEKSEVDEEIIPKHLQEFIALSQDNQDVKGDDMQQSSQSAAKLRRETQRIPRMLARNRRPSTFWRSSSADDLLHEIDHCLVYARGFLFNDGGGIWSPGQRSSFDREELQRESTQGTSEENCPTAIWTPKSAGTSPVVERREFRPVPFDSPTLARKKRTKSDCSAEAEPPWKNDANGLTAKVDKLSTNHSSPGPGFAGNLDFSSRLPKIQNPTITLLQKAREGQLSTKCPTTSVEQERCYKNKESPYNSQSNLIYQLRTESLSDSDNERPKIHRPVKFARKPTEDIRSTNHGVPSCLRSEIRDANMSQWYKRMYDTIHKARPNKYDEEEFVTVRYKQRNRDRYPFTTGYLSEPEPCAYDSDSHVDKKFATLDRRRMPWHSNSNSNVSNYHPQSSTLPSSKRQAATETTITYKPEIQQSQSAIQHRPGRIEKYTPGKSSITEHEAKKWWDEVMDIFDGMEKQQRQAKVPLVHPKGHLSQTLKENGYDSDSTLVFRRKEEIAPQLSPSQQREAYKSIQKGGDVPLHGLRKSIPDRPKDEAEDLGYSRVVKKHQSSEYAGTRSRSTSKNKEHQVLCYLVQRDIAKNRLTPSSSSRKVFAEKSPAVERILRKPPSPPRRKSSRNNTTLRMIHSGKYPRNVGQVEKSPTTKRHDICFSPTPKRSSPTDPREKTQQKPKLEIQKAAVKKVMQKCYCTKSKPCSKCANSEKSSKTRPQAMKKSVDTEIFTNTSANKLKSSLVKPLTKRPASVTLKKCADTSTKAKNSKTSILIEDDDTQKKLKKTKIKKDFINHQTKSENKSSPKVESISKAPTANDSQPGGFFHQLFFGRDKSQEDVSLLKKPSVSRPTFEVTERKCDPTLGALKLYLSHTKPVTESKFRCLDLIKSRSSSAKGMLPGKHDDLRERSISLPPKLIFTETSRPVTPIIDRKKLTVFQPSVEIVEPTIEKLYFSQTSRPVSPMVFRRDRARTPSSMTSLSSILSSPCPSPSDMLYFSETSRPVSPIVFQQPPPRPISPIYVPPSSPNIIRSPSYRRIKQKRMRTMSADTESRRSQRFQDLNKFYQDLERLDHLERATSVNNQRHAWKSEDGVMDYDHWQEVRQQERARREVTALYRQLSQSQQEHDFLFKPKVVCKWRRDLDRGLRIKEKSVDNLRQEFEQIRKDQLEKERKIKEDLRMNRGVYKTSWRGNSVVNLAKILNESVRSKSESRVPSVRQRVIDNEELLNYGVGSRIWSSLSLEQVNILKNQLTQIYGNDERFKKPAPIEEPSQQPLDHSILVDPKHSKPPKELRVRRNSDSSDSVSDVNPRKIISEEEKKKLSQSLSKEIMDFQLGKSTKVLRAKETRGAIAVAEAKSFPEHSKTNKLRPPEAVVQTQPEITTGYTEYSTKTVISNEEEKNTENKDVVEPRCRSPQKTETILAKVEYFENKEKEVFTPTIYKASEEPVEAFPVIPKSSFTLPRSQSNQDLRELYGQTDLKRMTTEPLSASRKTKYVMPSSPLLRSTYSRCRSLSPDAKYPPSSTVGDLKDKFEVYYYNQKFYNRPRRCASDPGLSKYSHDGGKVSELRLKFEYPKIAGRGRSRVRKSGLISSSYLKAEDRYMPHINIISKIASLYPKSSKIQISRSSEDLAKILGIPEGEVTKLRERFDTCDKNMSILGHMFTSSPNLNELRDVAQYLTGNWYAHKYAKAESTDLVPKQLPRPKSTSPTRPKNRLASILKLPKKSVNGKREHFSFQPFRSWWTTANVAKHCVHFKEPEGPPPPPPSVENEQERVDEQLRIIDAEAAKKYVENEVNIHYRMPVRQEVKELIDEQELARRQANAMRKIYEEERQRKHLQVSHSEDEVQDRKSRRHTDNFMPSEKSPISLNRYDDFVEEMSASQPQKVRALSPQPRLVARALFNFIGQSARELTFRKGDFIYIRRQIDKNWYEGEINAMVGLFPANYVEIVPYDGVKSTPRKAHEGQARAKYNFIAQSHLELSLAKGELVVVTRRVDDNWFEGRIGGRKGIFPVTYVEVLIDPTQDLSTPTSTKPVASPAAHSMLVNGTSSGKESMGAHNYLPTFPTQDLGMSYRAKPIQVTPAGAFDFPKRNPVDQALHIDIQNEPISYRALYKYKPQNEDELELLEGDVVQVLEKCDDGWYVGTSERTGAFGTFPGNYVDKIVAA